MRPPLFYAHKLVALAFNTMRMAGEKMGKGKSDPCWDGYRQEGMKKKGGKMVPNCVPINKK